MKGIGANLKPNDPLLLDFGRRPLTFVRVKEVKPDPAANRTLVTLQDWRGVKAARAIMASPEAIAAETKRQLSSLVTRYLGAEADRIGLSRDTKMYGNVSGYLEALHEQLAEDIPFPAIITSLNDELLPKLEVERQIAEGPQYTRLRPWRVDIIIDL